MYSKLFCVAASSVLINDAAPSADSLAAINVSTRRTVPVHLLIEMSGHLPNGDAPTPGCCSGYCRLIICVVH